VGTVARSWLRAPFGKLVYPGHDIRAGDGHEGQATERGRLDVRPPNGAIGTRCSLAFQLAAVDHLLAPRAQGEPTLCGVARKLGEGGRQ
jgi:hypothetical protein